MAKLLGAWLLFGASGWAFVVAIAVFAYLEEGAGGVALISVARLIPGLLAAPVAGDLLDRAQRDRIAALFCVIQAAAMAGVAVLVLGDASLLACAALVAVGGAAAAAPRPALQTMMPALARSPEELTRATAWWGALDGAGFLLGSGVGGLAIAAFDPGPVIAASAVVCALAGALAILLPATAATLRDEEEEEPGGLLATAAGGFRALRKIPALRAPVLIFTGLLISEGLTDVQLVALAIDDLDMGEGGPGILYGVWGAGGVVGSALVLWMLRRRGYGLAMATGMAILGLALALSGGDGVVLALVMMVPAGLGFAMVEMAAMGLVPRLADDAMAGRIYGLYELIYAGGAATGALIAPPLIALVGVRESLAVTGAAYVVLGALAWRALARLDEGQGEATRVRELLRGVPFLRPLPLPRLERLVRDARPVSAPAGTNIISRGEPGDTFFVIEQGTVDIVEYGRTQGPNEGFGEIALLKDIPRTATVRAVGDVSLRAIGRHAFLGAITNDGDAGSIADQIVGEHLARPMVDQEPVD